MESWLSGRKHLTANEAYGNVSEVRILLPQQTKHKNMIKEEEKDFATVLREWFEEDQRGAANAKLMFSTGFRDGSI